MKYQNTIFGVDFDGTCTTHEYPEVGRYVGAERVLHKLVKHGARLILWTMRSGKELQDAIDWYAERDIPLFGINENPEQKSWTTSPKAYANCYIDDAALNAPLVVGDELRPYINWDAVDQMLFPEDYQEEREEN